MLKNKTKHVYREQTQKAERREEESSLIFFSSSLKERTQFSFFVYNIYILFKLCFPYCFILVLYLS